MGSKHEFFRSRKPGSGFFRYKVIKSDDLNELCTVIDAMMESGWQPAGGIAVITDNAFSRSYLQAMSQPEMALL